MQRCFTHIGHGGHDSGNEAILNGKLIRESDLNLRFGKVWEAKAKAAGIEVMLSRYADDAIDSIQAAAMAKHWPADFVLSFHCNDAGFEKPHGVELWTSPGQTESDYLATQLYIQGPKFLGGRKFRADWEDGDPDKEEGWAICRKTGLPAVLVEFGFMSNPDELAWLCADSTPDQVAEWLLAGTTAWFIDKRARSG